MLSIPRIASVSFRKTVRGLAKAPLASLIALVAESATPLQVLIPWLREWQAKQLRKSVFVLKKEIETEFSLGAF
jgi:hypothetical protein